MSAMQGFGRSLQIPKTADGANFTKDYLEDSYQQMNEIMAMRIETAIAVAGRAVDYTWSTGAIESIFSGQGREFPLAQCMGQVAPAVISHMKSITKDPLKPKDFALVRFFCLKVAHPLFASKLKNPAPLVGTDSRYELISTFCRRGCKFDNVMKSCGFPIENFLTTPPSCGLANVLLPNFTSDEGLSAKRLSGMCLGEYGYAPDSNAQENQKGQTELFTAGLAVAQLLAAAKDLAAIEMVENGQSPLILSVIFREKQTGQPLRASEALMHVITKEKRRLQASAISTKLCSGENKSIPRSSSHHH